MRNLKIVLAYDGKPYHGWQVQPGLPTVQGTLSEALLRITGETIQAQGSGRTDSGVHALAQVASLETNSAIPCENFRKALNANLPPSIRVLQVEEHLPDFHARHSVMAKTYEYRMCRGEICSPFLSDYVTHYPYPLNETSMMEAAGVVIGEHDFTSFAAADPEKRHRETSDSNRRTIFLSFWERRGDELVYTVRGDGFLHHMVRNLVGTFILIGKGSLKPSDVSRIIASRDRSAAGATAPPQGLYLVSVEY